MQEERKLYIYKKYNIIKKIKKCRIPSFVQFGEKYF